MQDINSGLRFLVCLQDKSLRLRQTNIQQILVAQIKEKEQLRSIGLGRITNYFLVY